MNKKTTLTLASGIFTLVAITHLVRYFLDWEISINNCNIPQWLSLVAAIITGIIASKLCKYSCK